MPKAILQNLNKQTKRESKIFQTQWFSSCYEMNELFVKIRLKGERKRENIITGWIFRVASSRDERKLCERERKWKSNNENNSNGNFNGNHRQMSFRAVISFSCPLKLVVFFSYHSFFAFILSFSLCFNSSSRFSFSYSLWEEVLELHFFLFFSLLHLRFYCYFCDSVH